MSWFCTVVQAKQAAICDMPFSVFVFVACYRLIDNY